MGLYTDKPQKDLPLRELCGKILHTDPIPDFTALQYCEDYEGGVRRYNVYRVSANGRTYVLKRSEAREINVYQDFLSHHDFRVPKFYGSAEYDGHPWILIAHISGPDLRDCTDEIARAAAGSIAAVMNAYWQSERPDGRFQKYWERINRRAQCLADEPDLRRAYDVFLARQRTCPRTLCSGDYLPYNAIYHEGAVYIIDWAFAGIMPYSLDVARMIAHGTEDRRTFPFYMTDRHKEVYVREVYGKLEEKPSWDRYLLDVRLSVLNEYIEFIEYDLNHPEEAGDRDQTFAYYYAQAKALAAELLCIRG